MFFKWKNEKLSEKKINRIIVNVKIFEKGKLTKGMAAEAEVMAADLTAEGRGILTTILDASAEF
jgi:hypothetical protein